MLGWPVMASVVMERLMQETTASSLSSQVRQQNSTACAEAAIVTVTGFLLVPGIYQVLALF